MAGKRRLSKKAEEKAGYILDKELVSLYARQYDLLQEDAKRIVESVFELAKHVLITRELLSIRGFGIFTIKNRKRVRYRNNYTGQIDEVPLVRVLKYSPARSIKDMVNAKGKEESVRYLRKQAVIKKHLKERGILGEG